MKSIPSQSHHVRDARPRILFKGFLPRLLEDDENYVNASITLQDLLANHFRSSNRASRLARLGRQRKSVMLLHSELVASSQVGGSKVHEKICACCTPSFAGA